MKLTIFGATGGTGVEVVRQAADAGHEVTAVVRDESRLPATLRERMTVVEADVMDPASIARAVKDCDAVISAMGSRGGRAPTTVCADSSRSIISAMDAAGGGGRLVMVSASGLAADAGDDPFTRYVVKPMILQPILKHTFTDMLVAERQVRASALNWTIVRPPRLTDKPAKGTYRSAVDRNVRGGWMITRADLAKALLDVVDDPASTGHIVSVAN
ncbi:NAD(P)-dependent oxidoreductase [Actinomadura rudentiformis]|uniref:SDR family oxidoreductase n=1 Tax=Actinomadura rudentiformis TaxID=359158 RepID=A0A6H9YM11_9ACTN|nr:SDR family oxidoreductase [Actinomadura rudentiformis]KAB2343067.1 SDR family oxidoreductase [Actinomadura rudentiformis]